MVNVTKNINKTLESNLGCKLGSFLFDYTIPVVNKYLPQPILRFISFAHLKKKKDRSCRIHSFQSL